jgi:transposase InsO family protein
LDNVSQQTNKKALAHLASDDIQTKKKEPTWLWHRRLGHPSFSYLQRLFPSLFNKCNISDFLCETCVMAKCHRTVFPSNKTRAIVPFSLVHTDVWGPAPHSTHNGMRWFISFIDDCTRVTWVYLLKHKSDVNSIFRLFHQMVLTQFNTLIKVIRSDNGGEYFKTELTEFMNSNGILHQTTCPHSPQQNGVAERKNRHILEVTRSILIGGSVPSFLWGEAISSAVYLINRTPSSVLNFRRPLDVLSDHCILPPIVHLIPRIFGCVVYVHLHPHQRTKLEKRAVKCMFVGYGSAQKGYRAYHPPSKKFYISMDVTFYENNFYYPEKHVSTLQVGNENDEVQNHDVSLFDISNIKLPLNDHTTRVEPIFNDGLAERQDEDNTSFSFHDPLVQPSPQVSLDSTSINSLVNEVDSIIHETTTTNTLDIESPTVQYTLPSRSNRGKPPNRYEPDLQSKVKYPRVIMCLLTSYPSHMQCISQNYLLFLFLVMCRKLWQTLGGLKLSMRRWRHLRKMTLGILCNYLLEKKRLDASGCLQLNTNRMELLKGIKHD